MGVLLIAIKISSDSSSKTTSFANKISLGISQVGKVENTTRLIESATKENIQCSFRQEYHGFSNHAQAPSVNGFEDIPTALEWFRREENLVGIPMMTLLRHYSVLDGAAVILNERNYETQMPVKQLRDDVDELYRRVHDPAKPLPPRYHDLKDLTVSLIALHRPNR